MKAIAMVLVAGVAGTAAADIAPFDATAIDRTGMTIYSGDAVIAAPLDSATSALFTAGTAYENMALGTNFVTSSGAAGGVAGTADYDSAADDDINMGAFRFVGGVAAAGGVLFFDFFDSAGNFYDGFGVQLSSGGNFIYTITLTTPQLVQDSGFVQMFADDGSVLVATNGTWFLNNEAPTIGSAGAIDVAPDLDYKFAIDAIPAPGSVALLGLGGMVAARRRR